MRQVRQIMGMPISIDIPECSDNSLFERVFSRLREIDGRFSTYKSGSEVSRFAAGQLSKEELSNELKDVIKACEAAEEATDGYFSAWYAGGFNPSGYVKGWAIAQAGKIIKRAGQGTFCIGAGGDILAASDGQKTWEIGIQHPLHKQKILNVLSIKDGAVTTSGSYERGQHILNPKTRRAADEYLSVTVTGPDIITADILATAIFAAGSLELIDKYEDYAAFAVDTSGIIHRTG